MNSKIFYCPSYEPCPHCKRHFIDGEGWRYVCELALNGEDPIQECDDAAYYCGDDEDDEEEG